MGENWREVEVRGKGSGECYPLSTPSDEEAASYDKPKEALLKNFDMTERGFRKKFRYSSPENKETFIQFSSRLNSYLSKWLAMAKVEKTYEVVCDFMERDQFLESEIENCMSI